MLKINDIDFDIKKIADSGQCFRMTKLKRDGVYEIWQIIAAEKYCYIKVDPFNKDHILDCPNEDNQFWIFYFDLNRNYEMYRLAVDKNDTFLQAAVEYGTGIRILNQHPWEMLITYIISQRRSIPSIKTCVERLSKSYGKKLADDIYAFPSPNSLYEASLDDLKALGLGYRAEYVYLATRAVLDGSINLMDLYYKEYDIVFPELKKLKGVGDKVANCIALFAYHRIEAFPVDVWIQRVVDQYYDGYFPVERYPGFAGVIQQYMFYYIRSL